MPSSPGMNPYLEALVSGIRLRFASRPCPEPPLSPEDDKWTKQCLARWCAETRNINRNQRSFS